MKKLFLILLLASPVLAGKKYGFQDPKLNDELDNNYKEHQYPSWVYAKGSSMTVTQLNVSSAAFSGSLNMGTNKITNLAAGVASTDAANVSQLTASTVFQVVHGTSSASTGTTSATYQTTGLTATITPSASSHRILITVNCGMLRNTRPDLGRAFITIFRGSTNVGVDNGMTGNATTSLASGIDTACNMQWIDSPATTSATTYSARVKSADTTSSTVTFNVQSQTISMVLEEIL